MRTHRLSAAKRACLAVTAGMIGLWSIAVGAKDPPPNYIFGPAPAWDRFKELGEEAILARLVDPDSAKFEWPYGYVKSVWKPLLARKIYGYVVNRRPTGTPYRRRTGTPSRYWRVDDEGPFALVAA